MREEVWQPSRFGIFGTRRFSFESELGTIIYYDPLPDESPFACMKRNEVEEADIVISSHGYDDLGMLLKISIALKPFWVSMRCVWLRKHMCLSYMIMLSLLILL